MKPTATRERIRCRLIQTDDLAAISELLCTGFPGRKRQWWERGLARLEAREAPEGMPRYGYCLDTGSRIAGVILLIASARTVEGMPAVFSNVAGWYVDPNYRAYSQLLVSVALRNKEVTYTNVTPAPHTWDIVENQGYTRYCNGFFVAAALLTRPERGVTLEVFDPQRHAAVAEARMLQQHQGWGCTCLVIREDGRESGIVFRRFRLKAGKVPLPAMLALHAPDRAQLIRIAGNLGWHFLPVGAPFLVMDAQGPVEGLAGRFIAARGRKYFKGPHCPALSDLSGTEYAVFGV